MEWCNEGDERDEDWLDSFRAVEKESDWREVVSEWEGRKMKESGLVKNDEE